jgi:histidinol-phosphate aminotransferase
VSALAPYVQGKSALAGIADPIKLSSNESALGPSPAAIEAFHAVAADLHRYPDGAQTALREAIAEVHGIEPERIVCGNGSEELLSLLIRAYVGPGDELLLSENHFSMFAIHGRTQGATIVIAPERDYQMDVDALLAKVTARTRAVFIANPNNPTGTYLAESGVRRLHAGLPAEVLLVLDGAYAEYVTAADYEAGAGLVRQFDNVVATRSFSKAYGLAGLRIGWCYAPAHVVDVIQRIRTPFNTNRAALAAAAAAVRDQALIARVREHNARWLERMTTELGALGFAVVPSVTNFYLLDFSRSPGLTAQDAAAHLERRGIIPRKVTAGQQENVLRITVGLDHENEAALAALREYAAAAGGARPKGPPNVSPKVSGLFSDGK